MLYVAHPFVPIFRCAESLPKRLMRCQCVDLESGKWISYTLEWDHISSDDAAEQRDLLAPTTYQPTIEDSATGSMSTQTARGGSDEEA
jgi:hypothetical protein